MRVSIGRRLCRTLAWTAACAALLWSTGCVSSGEGDRMQADFKKLQIELQQLQDAYSTDRQKLNDTLTRAQKDVDQLNKTLEDARALLGRNNADLGADMDQLRKAVDVLRGQLDVSKRQFDQLQKTFEIFQKDVDIRLNSRSALPSDPDSLFLMGESKLGSGDTKGAREALEKFTEDFASDSRADEALVMLGEAYLRESRHKDAARQFTRVLKDSGADVKDRATLRMGDALVGMNRCDDARIFYDDVIKKFRRSSFRKEAAQKIKKIDRRQLCN